MLEDSKQVIDRLLAAGLSRRDFSVTTVKRTSSYKSVRGRWESTTRNETNIKIKCDMEKVIKLIYPIAEQGFNVRLQCSSYENNVIIDTRFSHNEKVWGDLSCGLDMKKYYTRNPSNSHNYSVNT